MDTLAWTSSWVEKIPKSPVKHAFPFPNIEATTFTPVDIEITSSNDDGDSLRQVGQLRDFVNDRHRDPITTGKYNNYNYEIHPPPLIQGQTFMKTSVAHPMSSQQFRDRNWSTEDVNGSDIGLRNFKTHDVTSTPVLLPQQREWRKTIGQDLPKFDGTPECWPEYLNRYQMSTVKCGYDKDENMSRLRSTLVGKAKETVRDLMMLTSEPQEIIDTLKRKFGRPDTIIRRLLVKLRKSDGPKDGDYLSFLNFANMVRHYVAIVGNLDKPSYLQNSIVMDELVQKLSESYRLRWGQCIGEKDVSDLTLMDLSSWLNQEAMILEKLYDPAICKKKSSDDEKKKTFVMATSENKKSKEKFDSKKTDSPKTCLFCKKKGHILRDCYSFLKLDCDKRWDAVSRLKLCFRCLDLGHQSMHCPSDKDCEEEGCGRHHHILLHHHRKTEDEAKLQQPQSSGSVSYTRTDDTRVLTKVVAVNLHGPTGMVWTFALLDDGSEMTIIEEELANRLGLRGRQDSFQLRTANGVTSEASRHVHVHI